MTAPCTIATVCALTMAASTWSPSDSELEIMSGARCEAEIHISNNPMDMTGEATGELELARLSVVVQFDRDVGDEDAGPMLSGMGHVPDRYTAIVPDGYIARPESITLWEGESGLIEVCEWSGA